MPGAQGAAAAGAEPPPATTTGQEGQPKVHRARKTMSKPGNGQVSMCKLVGRMGGISGWALFLILFLLGCFFIFFPLPFRDLAFGLLYSDFFFEFTNRLPSVRCGAGLDL